MGGSAELVRAGRNYDLTGCDKCEVISRCARKRFGEIVAEGQVRDDDTADGSPSGRIPREIGEIAHRLDGHVRCHVPS